MRASLVVYHTWFDHLVVNRWVLVLTNGVDQNYEYDQFKSLININATNLKPNEYVKCIW